jgi:hypothetical protein
MCEIVSRPPNVASASLHRKLGLEPFIDMVRPGGVLSIVWARGLSPDATRSRLMGGRAASGNGHVM